MKTKEDFSGEKAYKWYLSNRIINIVRQAKNLPLRSSENPYVHCNKSQNDGRD